MLCDNAVPFTVVCSSDQISPEHGFKVIKNGCLKSACRLYSIVPAHSTTPPAKHNPFELGFWWNLETALISQTYFQTILVFIYSI